MNNFRLSRKGVTMGTRERVRASLNLVELFTGIMSHEIYTFVFGMILYAFPAL